MQLTTFLTITLFVLGASAASLQPVSDYGNNPAKVPMYIYVPDKLATNPAVVMAIHYCTGTAQAYFSGTAWKTFADQKGFIVIYPSSPHQGACWDVSSKATLTHNGGGDSNSIANMATYAITKYNADPNKVFVTGTSSGAMMTNVMAAAYPNIFKAGSVYSGVPAGCFMSSSGAVDAWNSTCAQGQSIATPQVWAQVVRNMGGSPPYPRMQIWHGSVDAALLPQNYQETIKQWTGVFNLPQTPTSTQANTPQSGYTTYNYSTFVQGIYAQGVGHTVPEHVDLSMNWFGI
jgi:acetylxylan esterase